MTLGVVVDDGWRDGRYGDKATATAILLESITRDPHAAATGDLTAVRRTGVTDSALVEAIYVAYAFNIINRIADTLDFSYRSDRDRVRGPGYCDTTDTDCPAS